MKKYAMEIRIADESVETELLESIEEANKRAKYMANHYILENAKNVHIFTGTVDVPETVTTWAQALDYFAENDLSWDIDKCDDSIEYDGYLYAVRDYEAGNIIDTFTSYADAYAAVAEYEDDDREQGNYSDGFYEIYDVFEKKSERV